MHTIDPDTIEAELEATPIEALLCIIRDEAEELASTLAKAQSVQWLPMRPIPTEPGRPADPTGETVADPDRLSLRLQVIRSERLLRESAIHLRGVRLGLDRAIGFDEV